MKKGLTFKFAQNKQLIDILLATGESKLIESSPKDDYWGGLLPNSQNKLGEMLMMLRDNIRKNKIIFIEGSGLDPIKI